MLLYYEFFKFEVKLFFKSIPLLTGLYILTVLGVFLVGKAFSIEGINSLPTEGKIESIVFVYCSILIARFWLVFYRAANDVRLYKKIKNEASWGLWFEILIIGIPYTLTAFVITCMWLLCGKPPLSHLPVWVYASLFFIGWVVAIIRSRRYLT